MESILDVTRFSRRISKSTYSNLAFFYLSLFAVTGQILHVTSFKNKPGEELSAEREGGRIKSLKLVMQTR
jgi:hypothetical protein